jgi:CheY-like chemotaxis protein
MPGKNGNEVLTELKSDPNLRQIPVCMLSNADLENEVCDCYTRGASFYFKKPSTLDDFIQFLHHFKGMAQRHAQFCGR